MNKVVMNCANITRKDSNWENMLKECPAHRMLCYPVLGCENWCSRHYVSSSMAGVPEDASPNSGRDLSV